MLESSKNCRIDTEWSQSLKRFHFQAPEAVHRAKVLYFIKIWMFHQQFKLTKCETNGIRKAAASAVLVCIRSWITASLPVEAAFNDFHLMDGAAPLIHRCKNFCCDHRAGGRTPRTPRPGGGASHCSGASCYVWKKFFCSFLMFSKYL